MPISNDDGGLGRASFLCELASEMSASTSLSSSENPSYCTSSSSLCVDTVGTTSAVASAISAAALLSASSASSPAFSSVTTSNWLLCSSFSVSICDVSSVSCSSSCSRSASKLST